MVESEAVKAIMPAVEVFGRLGVPYEIVGSLASCAYGVPRSTLDADIVADLRPEHAGPFVKMLGEGFYAEDAAITAAIQQRSSFNVIHFRTMFKIDIFLLRHTPFHTTAFARRRPHVVTSDPERSLYFAAPEDIVLEKLRWYEKGGRVSDRQWYDVQGVLKVQTGSLDMDYLQRWARELGVADLLHRAMEEAGV